MEKTKRQRNSGPYYRAVNLFKSKEFPTPWDISNLFTESSDEEISELVAEFFNRISLEYEPIENPEKKEEVEIRTHLQMYQVAAKLKSCKKPKSVVEGDIPPELVSRFYDQLAVPLTYVYNQTLSQCSWPSLWKKETVSVIPKNSSPASMSELRNLSCTPLFSKVLESFILEKLKEEIKLRGRLLKSLIEKGSIEKSSVQKGTV